MTEKKQEKKYESIKVKLDTREKLKGAADSMGVGIGKAVEMLVDAREQAIAQKVEDIGELANEVADILLDSGLLDVKFRGAGVEDAELSDNCLVIRGFIKIEIPDENARKEILGVLRTGLER